MNRKVIRHIRDLQSQRLLATVVAFDTSDGVKVGWSIANWSASGKKESTFMADIEVVDFNPQPSKKLGVIYATLNAQRNFQPLVSKRAYVRHSFVKTDLMEEIYKIAENLRFFLENPRKSKESREQSDTIEQTPFTYDLDDLARIDCVGGGCCCGDPCDGVDPLLAPGVMMTCFENSEFNKASLIVMCYFEELQNSVKKVTDAFRDFYQAGAKLEVVDIEDAPEQTTGDEGVDLQESV